MDSDHREPTCGARGGEPHNALTHRNPCTWQDISVRLAGATGLEPATSGVTGRRSNQLSYAPVRGEFSMPSLLGRRLRAYRGAEHVGAQPVVDERPARVQLVAQAPKVVEALIQRGEVGGAQTRDLSPVRADAERLEG
jgi:hypothetical protein